MIVDPKRLRPKPDDFRSTYIEVGKPGCEAYYRAHWKTVDRWVEEEGKTGLRAERAAYVKSKRVTPKQSPKVIARGHEVDADDLHAACQFLRERRNGGWAAGLRDDGRYFVGARTLTGAELIERALAKGMDVWYVENDIRKRIALSDGIDEWVLEREAGA